MRFNVSAWFKKFRSKLAPVIKLLLQKRWVRLIVRTGNQLGYDGAGDMAASLSYYTVLGVFPLLLGIFSVLGYVFPNETVQRELFDFFERHLPTSTGLLRENITSIMELRGTLGIVSLFGLFWSGGALFGAIGRAVNRALGIRTLAPFYIRKLRDLFLALGTGILFFIILGLTVVSAFVPTARLPFGVFVTDVISRIVAFLLVFSVFLTIYKLMPAARMAWRDIWPGALLGAFLFEIVRNLFAFYLARFANFQLVYGSIASVIASLV
jgi:membrane protein